ncbi:hypothetical protein LC55x_0033 [Lysobacter capsici]|uniref:Uncharacterized protein n=1 Tax=Lysobacter capsici AZ78 TaxID=1444315 RepID=A0A108UA78_9GAMM|nr:hypothetical protein LC55x_0033 [Lysobacter capsici]KWS05409.1 hypothetical protein AZ78_2961 [Lysobacter capsici AZ78]
MRKVHRRIVQDLAVSTPYAPSTGPSRRVWVHSAVTPSEPCRTTR